MSARVIEDYPRDIDMINTDYDASAYIPRMSHQSIKSQRNENRGFKIFEKGKIVSTHKKLNFLNDHPKSTKGKPNRDQLSNKNRSYNDTKSSENNSSLSFLESGVNMMRVDNVNCHNSSSK